MALREDNFESIIKSVNNDANSEKIISDFYNLKKDLNAKTEIPKEVVIAVCGMELAIMRMERKKLKKSAKSAREFLRIYKEVMISVDRKGRSEGIQFLGAIKQQLQNSSILSKVFGVDKE